MNSLSALFTSCRSNRPAKSLDPGGSQITKALASISAAGLVFASAGFGAVYAWTTGSMHGPLLPALMVAMAVASELAPRKPKKRTRGKGGKGGGGGQPHKRRLGNVVDLLKARGGRIEGGQRAIAKTLGLSKSRIHEVLHELAAAGAVRLATSRSGTMVALAVA